MGGEAPPVKSTDIEGWGRGYDFISKNGELRPRVAPAKGVFLGNIECIWM